MLPQKFYHGMSILEWEKVQAQGHFNLRNDFGRWLAAEGVYLFWNNPVLAYRWAALKLSHERQIISPINFSNSVDSLVVLEVKLKEINREKILDLTTPNGLLLLYTKHKLVNKIFLSITDRLEELKNDPTVPREYHSSVLQGDVDLLLRINGIEYNSQTLTEKLSSEKDIKDSESFNFDCAACTLAAVNHQSSIIIASIQEGRTFNMEIHEAKFRSPHTQGYGGISAQDHIELCVTDHSIIEWPPIPIDLNSSMWRDFQKYPKFWELATSPRGGHE